MPLVPAKCTNCGENLQVDNTKDAAICPACNTPYIVEKAINNYIINSNSTTPILAEGYLENGIALIKLGEPYKAEGVFDEMTTKLPKDWRGWLGKSIALNYKSETRNFLYESQIRKTAPNDILNQLGKMRVSVSQKEDNSEKHLESLYIAQMNHLNDEEEQIRKRLNGARKYETTANIGNILGVIAIIISVYLGMTEGVFSGIFVFIIFCILFWVYDEIIFGIHSIGKKIRKDDTRDGSKELNEKLENIKRRKEQAQRGYKYELEEKRKDKEEGHPISWYLSFLESHS